MYHYLYWMMILDIELTSYFPTLAIYTFATFSAAGRKRKKCSRSTYILSTDPTDLSRQGSSTLATVRSAHLSVSLCFSNMGSLYKSYCKERQSRPKLFRCAIVMVLFPLSQELFLQTFVKSYGKVIFSGPTFWAQFSASPDQGRGCHIFLFL